MIRKFSLCLILMVLLTLTAGNAARADDRSDQIAGLFETSFAMENAGNYDRALSDVQSILHLDPSHYIANYRAGWLYYLKADYADSIKYYTKAATIAPGAMEPQLGLMLPLMAAQKWTDAEALGKKLVERSPDNYLAGSRLAYIYYIQGKYKPAEQQYQAVLKNYPSEIDMMLGLGWTYLKEGRSAEAREMFQKVLSIRRQNANALAGMKAL